MKKYAFWNNKGGVGKTFLCFIIAAEYAIKHTDQQVCVIDLCPQANLSEILLGGDDKGADNLENILSENERRSIGGYFDKRLSNPDSKTGDEHRYVSDIKSHVDGLPENLHLVPGDPSLELQVQAINQLASVSLPEERWKNVHKWIDDLQESIASDYLCKKRVKQLFLSIAIQVLQPTPHKH